MAAEFKIGRLRYTWEGTWVASTFYNRDAVVNYQGKTYVCLVPNTSSGNFYNDLYFITQAGASTPYWQLIVDGKTWVGPWTTGTLYSLGNIALFGGVAYYCTTAHTSTAFATDAANWAIYTTFANWHTTWTPSTAYGINDVVKYGGIVYKCIANHTAAASISLGLEADQASWTVLNSGIEFTGTWTSGHRYRVGDLAREGADLWIVTAGHTATSTFDPTKWTIWMPGIEFSGVWSSTTTFQAGDIVIYGGYTYVSNTTNNLNNVPSIDSTDWTLLVQGYSWMGDWNTLTQYQIGDVIRFDGRLYEAATDNLGNNPASIIVTKNYASNVGTTLSLATTSGIVTGMTISSAAFYSGQTVISVPDSSTVILDRGPDTAPTVGDILNFIGVDYVHWTLLVPSTFWTNRWTVGVAYHVGDVAVWANTTYVCIQETILALGGGGGPAVPTLTNPRPDQDLTNTYWIMFIPHSRKNASNSQGDLETYNKNAYAPVALGKQSYVLRNTNNLPTWSFVNALPQVYYVSTTTGQDIPSYGTTWDQPWKSISYATNYVGAGVLYPNAKVILLANKSWMVAEMYQWMLYQKANSNSPFSPSSTFDSTKTQRDAGFVIDAVIYDMTRGGNSQTVAAALAYFAFGSSTTFISTAAAVEMPYFIAALAQLASLVATALSSVAAPISYQNLNAVPASQQSLQVINALIQAESDATTVATSLIQIILTALINKNTTTVPTPNSGISITLMVKTGTYSESLPIVVPENVAVVGDELRGVVVQPALVVNSTVSATSAVTSLFTANTTTGMADKVAVQFASPAIANTVTYTTLGGVVAGQTYYVVGGTVTSTQFGVTSSTGTYTSVAGATLTGTGTGSTFNVTANSAGTFTITVANGGTNFAPTDTVKILGTLIGGVSPANDIVITVTATALTGISTFTSVGSSLVVLTTDTGTMAVYGGDAVKDMFRLRNGTGLRNMTLTGLLGTLGAQDAAQLQRPTGGSYASLDPGSGPNDTSVWIFRRSPYVQNVTAFGNGCTALKIDGTLHNGGFKSIVANDFTHIVSDGIGVWCTGPGALTEVVSVFSYYGYIGYFAEAGGRIRGTNGNSSYGQYGVVAEGYDITEAPATGNVFNQSSQVQASVQSAFGTRNQLLKINYGNAGSGYNTTTTNLLKYSNNFLGGNWTTDGNLLLNKTQIAPTGYTEAWTLTGSSPTSGNSYLYQNMTLNPTGAVYTGLSGVNVTGSGISATFNVTVTSTAYVVTVNAGGSGYVTGNQLYIAGSALGGIDSVNDCILTVASLAGSSILTVTVSGTVPAGSAQNYTCSVFIQQGTASSVDLYGIFSGSSTVTSALNYNFTLNTLTASSPDGGFVPTQYGLQSTLVAGWYRLWFALNDVTGLNTQLQYRIYPKGYNGAVGTFNYFYGAQVEASTSTFSPSFYLETTTAQYTAYANYNITGAGTGVVTVGDETRSNSIFQTRVTDTGTGVGGSGYLTASNNAQAGNSSQIQIAQSDVNTAGNYTGMRLYINSGTGAGQYGYIGSYNASNKTAQILKESFTSLQVTSTASSGNILGLNITNNSSTLYLNQPVQFIPTFYTTSVTSTSLAQTTVTAATGGTVNTFTVTSTVGLTVNMPVTFTGTTISTVIAGYTYYISGIIDSQTIQITNQLFGPVWQLSNAGNGGMVMNFQANTSYIQAPTTNMVVNYPIQFTGLALGGVTVGTVYYINDVIDSTNFTIATTLVTVSVTATTSSNNGMTVASVGSLIPLNPIIFTSTVFGGVTDGVKYYISKIIDSATFSVSSTLLKQTVTNTTVTSNLITVADTSQFIVNNPIVFVGTTFGNILAETTYYILAINNSTTFTISQTPGGGAISLSTASGAFIAKTCPASVALSTASGTMTGTTTSKKNSLSLSIGTMNATFSTQLFGGVSAGTTYYIASVPTSSTFTVSATPSGGAITLTTKTGSMNVAAVGWDHINVGTPIQSLLDSSSLYYIEPRTTYTPPPFAQTTSTSVVALTSGVNWAAITYGKNKVMAVPSSGTNAAVSTDGGNNWTGISLPVSASWTGLAYGSNYWVAISSGGTGNSKAIYSNSAGLGWRISNLPSATTWSSLAYGNGLFVAIAALTNSAAYSTNYGATWIAATLPAALNWTGLSYGAGTFMAISSSGNTLTPTAASGTGSTATLTFATQSSNQFVVGQTIVVSGMTPSGYNGTFVVTATDTSSVSYTNTTTAAGSVFGSIVGNSVTAYSTNGSTWTVGSLPTQSTWSAITYGNGRFVAVANTSANVAYSFNGTSWNSSNIPIIADKIAYGQGVFVALSSTSINAFTSEGGLDWTAQQVTNDSYGAITFGFTSANIGYFTTIAGQNKGSLISAGCTTKARAVITSGVITSISEWEPGSGYTGTPPTITFTDPNVTTLATVSPRFSNGTLASPTFVSAGVGYNTNSTVTTVTGNGYADTYQTGLTLTILNLTRLPAPGDNLTITGNSQIYKVTSAYSVYGTTAPNLEANVSISPAMSAALSPANLAPIAIRSKYSQCRLTNHDFLNIGYGDFIESNYPGFPQAGYVASTQNQTVEVNFGRVFFTSTDQDGNFKVGNLFGVQQATGIVTLSASQFGLSGLSTLSLGGIAVGGSSVVITQFGTDSTFVANSNSVIPTQKAIKAYLTSRLSQGGSNTFTGQLIAGTVLVGGANKIASTIPNGSTGSVVKMASKVYINASGVDGNMAALDFFMRNSNHR